MSIVAPPVNPPPAVLYDIDWKTYTGLLRVLQTDRRLRFTYDRGTLEIMAPLLAHEGPADLLACFIVVLTEEYQFLRRAGRSVTLRRRRKQRGLEPDNCYWIANASRLQGKTHLDLKVDPPPDLAIEVDYTNSSIDRMSIYQALGVPEVWRVSGRSLSFYVLQTGAYRVEPNSLAFPHLAATDLAPFLDRFAQVDDATLVLQFREWVRQHLLPRSAPPSP